MWVLSGTDKKTGGRFLQWFRTEAEAIEEVESKKEFFRLIK